MIHDGPTGHLLIGFKTAKQLPCDKWNPVFYTKVHKHLNWIENAKSSWDLLVAEAEDYD